MKRYAIVRVDKDWCPYYADKEFIIPCSNFCENRFECKDCRYGDTKEQLIIKIAQVMLRKFIVNYLRNGIKPKLADEQIQIVYKNYLELAKEIVEFLGVE